MICFYGTFSKQQQHGLIFPLSGEHPGLFVDYTFHVFLSKVFFSIVAWSSVFEKADADEGHLDA